MGGGEKDASAGLFGFQKMFKSFVTYALMNVLTIEPRESGEYPDEAGYGAENFVRDGAAFGYGFFRVGQFQIAHRGAAETGNGEIEEGCVEACQRKRCVGQGPQ